MNTPLSLLLIDDHPLLRRGLAELLNACDDFQVIGTAANGLAGIELARELCPAMILLDLHMPGMGGLAALRELKRAQPDSLIIVLTASDAPDDLLAALRGGADGYVLKDSEPEKLLEYLQGCCTGQVQVDSRLTGLLASSLRIDNPALRSVPMNVELTERERQTLALIAEGLNNKLIARQLGISDGTVKIHVKHLLSKLNLHSRLELSAWAHRGGFVRQFGEQTGGSQ
jgi:two-component system nitrate/nitrite response regulator NarL